ncbi:unnamed protein product, partial [Mesorhabditis spiculigera]
MPAKKGKRGAKGKSTGRPKKEVAAVAKATKTIEKKEKPAPAAAGKRGRGRPPKKDAPKKLVTSQSRKSAPASKPEPTHAEEDSEDQAEQSEEPASSGGEDGAVGSDGDEKSE